MNALIAIFTWVVGLVSPAESPALVRGQQPVVRPNDSDTRGVHIVTVNPRTVIALEDTHFRPNR
jgi:hypothetical protein